MLRSIRAEVSRSVVGAREFVGNTWEWLTEELPEFMQYAAVNMMTFGARKREDLEQWAIKGYKVGQRVVYSESGVSIGARILSRQTDSFGEFTYEIETDSGWSIVAEGKYTDKQRIVVPHRSLRKGNKNYANY